MPRTRPRVVIVERPNPEAHDRRSAGVASLFIVARVPLPAQRVFTRGMGAVSAPSAEDFYLNAISQSPITLLTNAYHDLTTGTLSGDELAAINAANDAANFVASTSPITGQVNLQLLQSADAQAAKESAAAANVTGQSTGSSLANLADALQGTYSGSLLNPTGTGVNWFTVAEYAAILAAIGVGGYVAWKLLDRVL